MSRNSVRINVWIKPEELIETDDLCRKKGYNRSTLIRETLKLCSKFNFSPDEMGDVLNDYYNLREEIKNKSLPISSSIEWCRK